MVQIAQFMNLRAVFAMIVIGLSQLASWGAIAQEETELTRLRLSVPPFPAPAMLVYGIEQGFFEEAGFKIEVIDVNWAEQADLLAGRAVDVAMATLDEVVVKDRNLRRIDRRVDYALPAWRFRGNSFFSQRDILSLPEMRQRLGVESASRAFLKQLIGKKIAYPEGGHHEETFRDFVRSAGMNISDFTVVHADVEAGLNALEDPDVAMAAAAAVQRIEAVRRGYKLAIDSEDLGTAVTTGFVVRRAYSLNNQGAAGRFACAWYKTINGALDNFEDFYKSAEKFLSLRGAKAPTMEEVRASFSLHDFPRSQLDTARMFFRPDGKSFWMKTWDRTVDNLQRTDKAEAIPLDRTSFTAGETLVQSMGVCGMWLR